LAPRGGAVGVGEAGSFASRATASGGLIEMSACSPSSSASLSCTFAQVAAPRSRAVVDQNLLQELAAIHLGLHKLTLEYTPTQAKRRSHTHRLASLSGVADTVKALRAELRVMLSIRMLPGRVRRFWWQARRYARRTGDEFSLNSAARPAGLAQVLARARGRTRVVELGTDTAWSAIALALDDRARRVVTYDPCVRPEREVYLNFAGTGVRKRIDLRYEPDSVGPRPGDPPVQLLFIDSSHDRESVVTAFGAWRAALAPDAIVVFHDYSHPDYPGVRRAVADLDLSGQEDVGVFVWRAS
jgi:predicted O-methyltransferase YrrM